MTYFPTFPAAPVSSAVVPISLRPGEAGRRVSARQPNKGTACSQGEVGKVVEVPVLRALAPGFFAKNHTDPGRSASLPAHLTPPIPTVIKPRVLRRAVSSVGRAADF